MREILCNVCVPAKISRPTVVDTAILDNLCILCECERDMNLAFTSGQQECLEQSYQTGALQPTMPSPGRLFSLGSLHSATPT